MYEKKGVLLKDFEKEEIKKFVIEICEISVQKKLDKRRVKITR